MHQVEEAVPSRETKKMYGNVYKRSHAVANRFRFAVFFMHIERPEYNQRPPNNVFFGHKSPIAAVQTIIAIVAHGKVMVWWNNYLIPSNTSLESCGPFRRNLPYSIAESGGKFIAICIVSSVANHVWLSLPDPVQIDHTVMQANPVSRHTDNALYQIHALFGGIRSEEHRRVAAMNSTIRQDPAQLSAAQRCEAIDKYMVSHQQCPLHGA